MDYCAASNFQDAFVRAECSGLARAVVSINWAAWRETGMALRAAIERGASLDEALPNGMSTAEGIECFLRVIGSGLPQVLVSPQDVRRLIQRSAGLAPASDESPQANLLPEIRAVDADTPDDYVAPRHDAERLVAEIWQDLLGVPRIGIHDNFFDLGGDSLVSLQFINKARKAGLNFTNRQVFELQTIAELVAGEVTGQ